MLKLFKIIAIGEGISYLVLLLNMLIVKPLNLDIYKKLLYPIGMGHGLLFITYFLFTFLLIKPQKWNVKEVFMILFLSFIPLGTFYMEKKYLRNV